MRSMLGGSNNKNDDDGRPSWMMEEGDSGAAVTISSSTTTDNDQNAASYSWMDQSNDKHSSENKANNNNSAAPLGDGTTTTTTTTTTPAAPPSASLTKNQSAAQLASQKTWGQYFRETFKRDGRLLLISIAILIVMNIPYVKFVLYPFTIFSTWIHELCHGLAAIFVGGQINKLQIFPDTSGLAYTSGARSRGFVASAGYQGTAVIGCLLLLIRRTKRGPRSGTMGLAIMMVLSVLLWIRNAFGIVFIGVMGFVLGGLAWKLPSTHIRNLYMILAVTTCLNAITSVQTLFGASHVVNGQPSSTDAHSMADALGGTSTLWALLWFMLSIMFTIVGFIFAIPGPDEVADFVLCGTCQDLGLFKLCNCQGKRLCSRFFSSVSSKNKANNNNDA